MAYDWSGVRTQRIRRLKLAAITVVGLFIISAPVLAFS
ncbi:hypothetical protein DFR48_101309 [Ciceribacter lividus]|uniref:Uncharacterized protein n=1 Tax=Ciceribacter lividus TaxID=1197950 RepID=A0A6I7HSU7_9HYPH|nr:hypothetical protein DFR48_101309 [Ciceribacter lividus]